MESFNNLNDNKIRLIFIPLFGLIIPNAAGLIINSHYSAFGLVLAYLYFMFISFSIWQGNRYLLFKLREKFSWLNRPVEKILLLLLSNIFYTAPVTIVLLLGWYSFSKSGVVDWSSIFEATLMCVICVIFITHVYETVFLIRQWESDNVNKERLEKAKAQAELESLKNQVDPHFIFNSLNTLSYLIENDTGKAKLFNDNLADVYRYILFNKGRNLVLLKDEIEFLENYFLLIKIRFGEAICMNISIDKAAYDSFLIPPISLQLLMENAIKHNEFSSGKPLLVKVLIDGNSIFVENEIREKEAHRISSKTGLINLKERYKLITGKEISVESETGSFKVTLPLLKV